MAKRPVRARSKIATAHIPYAILSDAELPDRLAAVYLIATEAHAPTGGNAVARVDLEAEAVRLARLLVELMPTSPRCCLCWLCCCSPQLALRREATPRATS